MDASILSLKNGGIGVMPTDTIYGIVGQALDRHTVERIYTLKKRTPTKPFIILISGVQDLDRFGIKITSMMRASFRQYWPGPVSIIVECPHSQLEYLHRGTNSLAFRLPNVPALVDLIQKTGPLVAPSANPEGLPPAQDIAEAEAYFSNRADFYVEGPVNTKPSKIVRITENGEEIIRL